ncbi:ABC transporter permease [Candidatus Micrarchaeota archaeon]|nr:ABC transporter permease [Candidatus Micrarchaeota archaeon]
MSLLTIVKLELKFISAQGMTSLLILLYPLILMMVVGPIFSNMGAKGVTIALYSTVHENFPNFESQELIEFDTKEGMINSVISGQSVLGILFTTDESGRRRMYTYFDPQKEVVATSLAMQLQGKLADLSADLVETNLVSIHGSMKDLSKEVDGQLQKIPQLRANLKQNKANLEQLRGSMQNSDAVATTNMLSQMRSDAIGMSEGISNMRQKLSSWEDTINQISTYDSKLQYYDGRLAATDSQLFTLQNKLNAWDIQLQQRIAQLDSAYATLGTYLTIVSQVRATSTGAAQTQLITVENGIIDSRNQILSARNDLQSMRSDIQNSQAQIAVARNDIQSARNDISNTRASLQTTQANARSDLSYTRSQMDDASNKLIIAQNNLEKAQANLNSFSVLSQSMNTYLVESSAQLDSLDQDISRTQTLLQSMKSNIGKFVENDPRKYVPLKLESLPERRTLRPIDSIFPALLGLVSLLSCLLLPPIMSVKQKTQGLRFRMKLSYASTFSIVIGKFIGDYIAGLIQVMVVALLGAIFFGINLSANPLAFSFALFLAPAVFTAMGTLLSAFVSNEGSAVLSSLLVSMPMLFLSGIMLPIEQIQGAFKTIATLLPLYNVVEMISKTTVRDAAYYAVENYFVVSVYTFAFIVLALIFWHRKE